MSLPARKILEMKGKARALAAELAAWRARAAAKQDLEKHHSQVERLAGQILSAMAQLDREIDDDKSPPASAAEIEERILDFHRVWDFFRSKLLLRSFDHFQRYLVVADELAYACYKPVIDRRPKRKEPPLTFFSATSTPFAMPRNKSYEEGVNTEEIKDKGAVGLLKSLPVPVIGIPWFQVGHMPDLAIVAHEVGHHVEDDLGLTASLQDAVRNAKLPAARQDAWLAWCGEVFADVYATLAIGRAFPRALADFLLFSSVADMRNETIQAGAWGQYPTGPLRVSIAREVLRRRKTLDTATEQAMKPLANHAMADYEPDCADLVKALIGVPVPKGGTVGDLVSFDSQREDNAALAASAALADGALTSSDVRELIAAAALAYATDPEKFSRRGKGRLPSEKVVDKVHGSIAAGARNVPRFEEQQQAVAASRATDETDGVNLLGQLRGH